ncbi:glycerate kinase [Cellulomonas sp. ATA003]|uniref:glycerate kinase n=1 Tax=Cellulomonas sp. ATA003 TaxID=3073064 RepID=UPI002873B359|nr:glycerate kinase [Cellulomonas sp. ATA003]WNB84470.1 glycerate kinase [Cellulomonas sp. ATA003]
MRVLVAPDSFGDALPATAAARAIRDGWLTTAPHDDVRTLPLTDGGAGFVRTLHDSLGGELLSATVRSPSGQPVPAALLVVDDPAGGRTAYVEAAHATGRGLVPAGHPGPGRATSLGVGDLLRSARGTGATRVVVGVGDAASNDAGAGMLAALGVGRDVVGSPGDDGGVLAGGGLGLATVSDDDLTGLAAARADWAGIRLVAVCAADRPLLGLHGASAGATDHGASPEESQALERALGHFAHAAVAALGPDAVRPDLLASARPATPVARLAGLPGAGAGGGLGFALALLGARVVPGAAWAADEVRLDDRLAASDLVVTGEGVVRVRSVHDAVTATVAARALACAVPTVVIAGQVLVGRRELASAGISAAYPVSDPGAGPVVAGDGPGEAPAALASRAARVARTWSR